MTDRVIELLQQEWDALIALGEQLGAEEWDVPTDLPGWTVRDVYNHVIGTERMLSGADTPSPPAALGDHVRNPIAEINEAWVASRRDRTGTEVVDELREVTALRAAQLGAMSDADLDAVGFTPEGEGPYRRFMSIRVFDCWEHEQDVRRATGRPGHLDGPVAAHAINEVTSKLGYVVGKKAGAPDGTTVVFDLTGSLPRILPVFVDGRARILDHEPSARDVTIHLDTETFNALGCGRWTPEQARARGHVRIDGDEELGRRVLDNMAFTI
ncbi:MAG: maleylpyruvate isomerase family mycothiol-dependent enzyme [Acidimicrobiales bacterium]